MTFLIGFLFGYVGSVPIAGPIALLVFAYGVKDRARQALYIAAGGAIAEGAYAYMAFWGLTRLLDRYDFIVPYSRGVGAVVLLALGLAFSLRKSSREQDDAETVRHRVGKKRAFFLGFTVTALNPTLLVTWTAAATTLLSSGLLPAGSFRQPLPFALGAVVGIVAWFATLLGLLHRYKARFRKETLDRVVRFIGVALLGLSAWFGFRFLEYLIRGNP